MTLHMYMVSIQCDIHTTYWQSQSDIDWVTLDHQGVVLTCFQLMELSLVVYYPVQNKNSHVHIVCILNFHKGYLHRAYASHSCYQLEK